MRLPPSGHGISPLAIDGRPVHNKRRDNRIVREERVGLQTGFAQIQWLHFDNDFKQSDAILNVRLMGAEESVH